MVALPPSHPCSSSSAIQDCRPSGVKRLIIRHRRRQFTRRGRRFTLGIWTTKLRRRISSSSSLKSARCLPSTSVSTLAPETPSVMATSTSSLILMWEKWYKILNESS